MEKIAIVAWAFSRSCSVEEFWSQLEAGNELCRKLTEFGEAKGLAILL